MDPIRRILFLALLASVVMAEPKQARALTAAVIADAERPALVPGSWVRRLSTLLRKAIRPIARTGPRRRRQLIDIARLFVAPIDVALTHATFAAHAFRLPPPLSPAV